MRATEAVRFQQATGNTASFSLYGGIYQVVAMGFTGGSAQLFQLGPDGSTYLSCSEAFTANGGDTVWLPPGTFRWTVTSEASPIRVQVVSVPES